MKGTIPVADIQNPYFCQALGTVTISVGVEATNVITVSVQAKSKDLQSNIAERVGLKWYLSTDSHGDNLSAAPQGGLAAGAAGVVIEDIADVSGFLITNAAGLGQIAITDSGTPTFYIVIVLPSGKLVVSGAITFA